MGAAAHGAGRDGAVTSPLVLSLFPGIGLLDMAFEQEGFCVVRGPDLLWGGDVRRFHPPAGRFDGVIGGPPCQHWSALAHLVRASGHEVAPNLIPEYERCVAEAQPAWFVMENVPGAPVPQVPGFIVAEQLIRDVWVGGETSRLRRFSFGTHDGRALHVATLALHRPDPEPAVVASSGGPCTARRAGGAISKTRGAAQLPKMLRHQGLPDDFLSDCPLTVEGKIRVVGNGVPLPMGRAIARAVRAALKLGEQAA